MLLAFMYHHINAPAFSNSEPMFRRHIEHLLTHCNVVVPGEALSAEKMNVCLTFDDAGVDFYYFAYPLLRAYRCKALLAVPAGRIQDDTATPREQRLLFSPITAIHERHPDHFCTWHELQEITAEGLVQVASHGLSHINLLTTSAYEDELKKSKQLIEEKLLLKISSIVFPYGIYNLEIMNTALEHYRYLFGVGAVDNRSWNGIKGILYRIPADAMSDSLEGISPVNLLRYKANIPKMKLKTWLMKRKDFSY